MGCACMHAPHFPLYGARACDVATMMGGESCKRKGRVSGGNEENSCITVICF